MDEKSAKCELNAEWVLNRLQLIADTCIQPDEKGRIDSMGANKATELIGKHVGMFTDRKQIDLGERTVQMMSVYNLPLKEKLKLLSELDDELEDDE